MIFSFLFGSFLSVTVIVIGPSTFLPGFTIISCFLGSISYGIFFPSSSLTSIIVLVGSVTITPVPCFSLIGSTWFLFFSSTIPGFGVGVGVGVGVGIAFTLKIAFAVTFSSPMVSVVVGDFGSCTVAPSTSHLSNS